MKVATVYSLICPITNHIKYIGATMHRLQLRLWGHTGASSNYFNKKWIESLRSEGKKPIIEPIDIVPIDQINNWESFYIKLFKQTMGVDLNNNKRRPKSKHNKWYFRGDLSQKTRLAVSVVQGYYLGKGIRLTQPEAIDKIVEVYLKRPITKT